MKTTLLIIQGLRDAALKGIISNGTAQGTIDLILLDNEKELHNAKTN